MSSSHGPSFEAAFGAALDVFLSSPAKPYKERLEQLLLALPVDASDEAMMLMKESRGAPAALCLADSRTALFLGDARSGTALALAALGLGVTVLDHCPRRLGFALARADAYEPGSTCAVVGGDGPRLPFSDRAFDLVFIETGLPGPGTGLGFDAREARRVARREVFTAADNRLGYKRSTGRRGVFVRSPMRIAREALRPSRGERTLGGTRATVQGDWPQSVAYALYPHRREFSHVVGLDAPLPRLSVGPRERRNRIKVVAQRAGLFRWLTPSFGIHAQRTSGGPSRVDELLDEVARATGEARPELDLLIATRSNNALLLTRGPSAWAIHVPLQPFKRSMVRAHHEWMAHVADRYPRVPVATPLYCGLAAGLEVAVARRLDGLDGTEVTGDLARSARMFESVSRAVGHLADPEPTPFDSALWDELLEARIARVLRHVPRASTRQSLEQMAKALRTALLGRDVRLAMYHADLRPKHVKLNPAGELVGLLDWGASEGRFLPYVDMLQLVVHQRSQELGSFAAAWRALRSAGSRRPHEERVLSEHARAVGIDGPLAAALLEAFPLFVAGMAERNWDYSRPDWVARQFGL